MLNDDKTYVFYFRTNDDRINDFNDHIVIRPYEVFPRGGASIAIAPNGDAGIGICSDEDNFDKKIAREIALGRLKKNPEKTDIKVGDYSNYFQFQFACFLLVKERNNFLKTKNKGCDKKLFMVFSEEYEPQFFDQEK